MSKISIVIPAYNASKYIKETIESVLSQEVSCDIEIIVVDNGSTDDTWSIVNAIASKVNNIKLYHKSHGNAASSRNFGINYISGDFVIFQDADDTFEKDSLSVMYNKLIETNADCVSTLSRDFKSPEISSNVVVSNVPYPGALAGCCFMRKTVIDKIGPFDENLSSGETVDWMIRLKNSNVTIVPLDLVTRNRRVHLTNTTKVAELNYANALRKRIMKELRNK